MALCSLLCTDVWHAARKRESPSQPPPCPPARLPRPVCSYVLFPPHLSLVSFPSLPGRFLLFRDARESTNDSFGEDRRETGVAVALPLMGREQSRGIPPWQLAHVGGLTPSRCVCLLSLQNYRWEDPRRLCGRVSPGQVRCSRRMPHAWEEGVGGVRSHRRLLTSVVGRCACWVGVGSVKERKGRKGKRGRGGRAPQQPAAPCAPRMCAALDAAARPCPAAASRHLASLRMFDLLFHTLPSSFKPACVDFRTLARLLSRCASELPAPTWLPMRGNLSSAPGTQLASCSSLSF